MAKSIAKSCPLCLSVNDPDDMLAVTMPHSTPPQSAPMYLCRLCVLEVMKSAIGSELIDPAEVFPNAPSRDDSGGGPGDDSPAAAPADPLVLPGERGDEAAGVDRREPEVPAGGAGTCERCGKSFPDDELDPWEGPDANRMTVCAPCARELEIEL